MNSSAKPPDIPTESIILCEGYYDRVFWSGWLLRLGCTDPGSPQGQAKRRQVRDPWRDPVSQGDYAFYSPSGHFIRVTPCMGVGNILPIAARRLDQRSTKPLAHLFLSYDADVKLADTATGVARSEQRLDDLARQFGGARVGDSWMIEQTTLVLVSWRANDGVLPGLPGKQTLERLICAAVVAAYPDRGSSVQTWLDNRPGAAPAGPKHFGWSYYAGWYAHHGADDHYHPLWEDERAASELETRLGQSGAWAAVEELAR